MRDIKTFSTKNGNYLSIFLWGVLFLTFLLQIIPQATMSEAILFTICTIASAYPVTTYLSHKLLAKALRTKNYKLFLIQFVLFSVIVGAIFSGYITLFSLLEKMGYFPDSVYFDLSQLPEYSHLIFISAGIVINMCMCAVRFFQENIQLQKTLIEYQLQILQEQINPHFMFNVLNHINYYIERKDDLASVLLLKYSDILRYQLYSGKKTQVPLEEEIQFLKDFIDIEKIRWQDNLDISSVWKVQESRKKLSPLLLIPLIENAFKHVSRTANEKGYIKINFEQKPGSILLQVENSKSILSATNRDGASGLGIKNFRNRLDILYNDKYKLQVRETNDTYYSELLILA